MKDDKTLGVALAKEACPACGALVDGPILMNTKLTKKAAEKTESLHGKVIGYLDKPCDSCQDLMSKGFLLIGVDMDKTDDETNPYRSGHQWVITHEAVEKVFKDVDTKYGFAFISTNVARHAGLPINKIKNNEDTNLPLS